jgi:hypothetical protein
MKDALTTTLICLLSLFAGVGLTALSGLIYWLDKTKFIVG